MTGTPPHSPGRPKTGQTPPISFRPPQQLREEFDSYVEASGRNRSDVLISLMHEWVMRKRREHSRD